MVVRVEEELLLEGTITCLTALQGATLGLVLGQPPRHLQPGDLSQNIKMNNCIKITDTGLADNERLYQK